MAFFGLFKSKPERELENTFQQLNEILFPRGEQDIERDCQRINALTNGKIPQDKLRGFVAGCKTIVRISESEDEARFIGSFMQRAEGRISEKEAYEMYAYFEGEATFYDSFTRQVKLMGGNPSDSSEAIYGDAPWIFSAGTREDKIQDGYGEFGLVNTNLVPTISVRGSNSYLANLRFGGHHVEANRLGSTNSDATPGSGDIYALTCAGRKVGTVFICPYHKRNSRKAPKGFSLVTR